MRKKKVKNRPNLIYRPAVFEVRKLLQIPAKSHIFGMRDNFFSFEKSPNINHALKNIAMGDKYRSGKRCWPNKTRGQQTWTWPWWINIYKQNFVPTWSVLEGKIKDDDFPNHFFFIASRHWQDSRWGREGLPSWPGFPNRTRPSKRISESESCWVGVDGATTRTWGRTAPFQIHFSCEKTNISNVCMKLIICMNWLLYH